jgi:cytochrome P450
LNIAYLKAPRLGVPLLSAIQRDPLGMAQQFRREHGDLVGMTILFQSIYYVFRPDAARQVLVEHHDLFLKEQRQLQIFRSVQGVNVLTTEGAAWQRQRRILMPQFMPRKIAGYMELMATATDDGIAAELPTPVGEARLIDVDRFTTRLTMDVILRTLFSYKASREESDRISLAARVLARHSMRELFWLFAPPDWLPFPGRRTKLKYRAILRDFIATQILARRAQATGNSGQPSDVLGMLLAARDEPGGGSAPGSLSSQEIHDNCLVIFLAGHDTSATALTWWLGLMAAHPPIAARVRAEIEAAGTTLDNTAEAHARLLLLNATLKEALRLYPPATGTFSRVAQRSVRVGEAEIPKGGIVAIPIWNIHHDERWFAQPETFIPERFMPGAEEIPRGAFLPFGAGPHFCLGQHFATAELALIAAQLIRHYDLSLDPGVALPNAVIDLSLKPQPRLFVRFTRRAPPALQQKGGA